MKVLFRVFGIVQWRGTETSPRILSVLGPKTDSNYFESLLVNGFFKSIFSLL